MRSTKKKKRELSEQELFYLRSTAPHLGRSFESLVAAFSANPKSRALLRALLQTHTEVEQFKEELLRLRPDLLTDAERARLRE
jgi:hypothetical protein